MIVMKCDNCGAEITEAESFYIGHKKIDKTRKSKTDFSAITYELEYCDTCFVKLMEKLNLEDRAIPVEKPTERTK